MVSKIVSKNGLLILIGFPPVLADMVLDLYHGLQRTIKMGKALGEPHHYHNGCGQGDVCALFPAIALVSGQFYMVEALYPRVRMGAVIDDRNFRGDLKDIEKVYRLVHEYDIAAGQSLQDEKTIITSTSASEREEIRKLDLHGHNPSCPDFFVMVGNLITTLHKHFTARANGVMAKTTRCALTLSRTAVGKERRAFAFGSAIVPRAIANANWNLPSFPTMNRLRTIIITGVWGCRALMRCVEVLFSILFDPSRIDPYFAALFKSFGDLRRMLRKNPQRYHAFVEDMMMAIRREKAANNANADAITGPVHGFLDACRALGIQIDTGDHGLALTSPYGTTTTILSADRTFYNMIIRDSIKHAILSGLQERTASPEHARFRKDMVGAGPPVDISATRANIDCPIRKGQPMYVDYDDMKNKATAKAVVAGSIRAPDRLKAAGLIDCGQCTTCGVRATTEHIFWHCKLHAKIRKQFLDERDRILNNQKKHRPATFKRLVKDFKLACFRNCGICPGDDRKWTSYNSLVREVDEAVYNPAAIEEITSAAEDATWILINDKAYLLAYTDGSAIN